MSRLLCEMKRNSSVFIALLSLASPCGCTMEASREHLAEPQETPQYNTGTQRDDTKRSPTEDAIDDAQFAQSNEDSLKSPESVIDRANAAALKKDWTTFVSCFTTETIDSSSRAWLSYCSLLASQRRGIQSREPALAKVFDSMTKPIFDALERHGVTYEKLLRIADLRGQDRDDAINEIAVSIPDREAMIADLLPHSEDTRGATGMCPEDVAGTVMSIDVNGDRAAATVDGEFLVRTVFLHKTANGWRIHLGIGF